VNVPFLDLNKLNLRHKTEILNKINSIIENGYFIRGNENKLFEEDFSRFLNQKHVIGVANGLDALRLIFRAYIELGRLSVGDEVIVPANTYIASVLAITENGLIPKFLEPNISSYNLDLSKITSFVSKKTKAVLMVHLYGQVSWDYNAVNELKKKGVIFVEDCAQSVGGSIAGDLCGSFGDASGFSFYPGKNLGAMGDGGAVVSNDIDLSNCIRSIANYGSKKKYLNEYKGLNSRLDEIQAAILRIKLPFLLSDNKRRFQIANMYNEKLKNLPIILPIINQSHVYHLYVIRSDKRAELQKFLEKKGIQTLIHYPIPPHLQKSYKEFNKIQLPITEEIHNTVLSLPISPVMNDMEVDYVCKQIELFFT